MVLNAIKKGARGSRAALSTVNKANQALIREVNKLDKNAKQVVNAAIAPVAVPYAVGSLALDLFDQMLPVVGTPDHPQIRGGMVAGVSQTMPVSRSKPRITSSQGYINIVHKELIGEITVDTGVRTCNTFTTGQSTLGVSPINQMMFPWLSSIAGHYDYFRFKRLRLVYVPLCSTATAGRVMIGFDTDANDAIPFDRSALSSYSNSVDSSTWGVAKLDCKLPNNLNWYKTNISNGTVDFNMNNQGQAFWASWAGSGASTVGELYVLYDVVLKDPQPETTEIYRAQGNGATVSNQFATGTPVSVSSTATTIVLAFFGTGTWNLQFFAKTTAASGVITNTASGGVAVTGAGSVSNYKVGDGTDAIISFQVNVTNTGFSTASGGGSSALITIGALAGLAGWTVIVNRGDKTTFYPSFT